MAGLRAHALGLCAHATGEPDRATGRRARAIGEPDHAVALGQHAAGQPEHASHGPAHAPAPAARPPSANDRGMDATADETAQTLPTWMACAGCGYDLAGLPRGAVCPECGLLAPASWPVWDLRRCERAYVERVHEGARLVRHAAFTIVLAVLCGAAAVVLARSPLPDADKLVYIGTAAAAALVFSVASGVKLAMLARALRLDAGVRDAPGAASHRAIVRDARLANWMLAGTLAIGGGLLVTIFYLGVLAAVVGVLAWLACAASLGVTGARFLGETIERAGGLRRRAVTGYAIELLPYVALGCFLLAGVGVMSWWWLAATMVAAPQLVAGHLALRSAQAQRVLKGLIEQAKPARS